MSKVAEYPKTDKQRQEQWQIEDAANTLLRAEQIKRDKTLMRKVRAHLKMQAKIAQENVKKV